MTENAERRRITIRISEEDYERLKFWAAKKQLKINEYIQDAIDQAIKRENGDYDLPSAETARLNQLIDVVTELSSNVRSLEDVTASGFDSLLGLTRGDNYLLEHENGEL